MNDNSNERYYRIGCNIYDRTKGAEWNVCCTSYKHALRATEALNRPPSGSVSDHGELVSWLRREAQFWRLANPAAKRGEALDSARCEDRANKIDEAATAIRNIQKPSEFYCQKCGGMLNEFSKCGKCLSTKPDTSNASDLASVPLLDWLDDGDRGEKGFTGYNLKFDEAFRIKDALSALPSTATSSEYQGVKIVEDPTLKDDEFKMVATSSDEPKP